MSLAWEGNVLYGSPFAAPFSRDPAFAGKVIDLLYGDPSARTTLGLTVARYNVGGGDGTHRHMTSTAQMEGFQDGTGLAFDFSRDAGQRRLLREVKARGANLFEAFSNSPPYWMTYSGCASGNATAGADNLDPQHDTDFVNYLVTVVSHFRQQEGVTFESLEPFNEPDGNWWRYGGRQEGCSAAPSTQDRVIPKLADALAAAGLTTFVAAADTNNRDAMTRALASYSARTIARLGRINTHSYSLPSNHFALESSALQLRKPLWMSEVGCCIGASNVLGERDDGTAMWSALWMADSIRLDLRDMNAEAWVFWQADWNVIDFNDGHTPIPKKQFYAMAHYTNFIRPGFQIIAVDANNSLAAYSASQHRLVLVAVNWKNATPVDYDLTAFSGLPGTLSVYRTTADASVNLRQQAGVTIGARGHLIDTLPVRSITTYVIDGVTTTAVASRFQGTTSPRRSSGLCLSVSGDARGPTAAPIILGSCAGRPDNEVFTYDLVSGHVTVFSGPQQMCLNVWGGAAANGAQIGTWSCSDTANERFFVDRVAGQMWMWAEESGKSPVCLDVTGHVFGNGAGVFAYACATSADPYQQFDIP